MDKWSKEITNTVDGTFHKVVMQGNKVVFFADIFNDSFIDEIIEHHNESISKSYHEGLKDGIKIIKETQIDSKRRRSNKWIQSKH